MPDSFRIAYLAHTLRSDWNNGNAHFLRGLLRALATLGHEVTAFEPFEGWSIHNLRMEADGQRSLTDFRRVYPDLRVKTYREGEADEVWRERLQGFDAVVLHEWNEPELAQVLLRLRDRTGYALLFHDTHHRASSTTEQMERFGLGRFDGVIAFGRALERIYRERYGLTKVWTLHEAADTTVFKPLAGTAKTEDVVWIGNWGEGERSREIAEFLLKPVAAPLPPLKAKIYGVRYPGDGLRALRKARRGVWRVPAEPGCAGGLCRGEVDRAYSATAVCGCARGDSHDSRVRGSGLRHSVDLSAMAGCRRTVS